MNENERVEREKKYEIIDDSVQTGFDIDCGLVHQFDFVAIIIDQISVISSLSDFFFRLSYIDYMCTQSR